jgi:hypothetical protein
MCVAMSSRHAFDASAFRRVRYRPPGTAEKEAPAQARPSLGPPVHIAVPIPLSVFGLSNQGGDALVRGDVIELSSHAA